MRDPRAGWSATLMSGIPLDEWSGSGATKALHETIREFNEATTRQTKHLIVLTYVIAILTLVMTVGVGVQIWLALNAEPPPVPACPESDD